jgi:hypothetical protein
MGGRSPDEFVLKRKDKALLLDVLRDGQIPAKSGAPHADLVVASH